MILDTACIYSGVFLKSLKLIFEKLWGDFCCWVLWTCLYDYQIKLKLLLLVINLECFVYQSQLIRVNEDPSKAACLLTACSQLACCMLAVCLLYACCMLAACDIFAIRLVNLKKEKELHIVQSTMTRRTDNFTSFWQLSFLSLLPVWSS